MTAIAAAASNPERVVGMHFFNPAPVMRLLEVVAGEQSSEDALALAHATGEAMGKTVIRASDGPGFLVNRCNRPFGLEALRLLQERIADVETIDRICRMEGGFRMGPFELMDLVGVDTGFEISQELLRAELRGAALAPLADRRPLCRRGAATDARAGAATTSTKPASPTAGHRPEDPDRLECTRRRAARASW